VAESHDASIGNEVVLFYIDPRPKFIRPANVASLLLVGVMWARCDTTLMQHACTPAQQWRN